MKAERPLLEDVMSDLTDSDLIKIKPQKKANGRPRSAKRLAADEALVQEKFVNSFESKAAYRPEPLRMIKALGLPPEKHLQALEDCMNHRQMAFCKEYPIDFNAEAAATRAGYSPKCAKATAYNLMQYRGIRRLIELYTQSHAQRITTIDADYVINKVTEIVSTATKDSDKLRGLELLARYLGMFIERTEISGRDGEAIKIEETRQGAEEVARKLREMGKKTVLASV